MNIEVKEIATDCHHSGLFPAPGAGKIVSTARYLYITYWNLEDYSVVLQFDGKEWLSSPPLPIMPPYLAVDTQGFIHVAGLHQRERNEIWYFRSRQPHTISTFDEGRPIHPRNYSAIAVDVRDDSLFYFGAGVCAGGIGFLRRTADGVWSERMSLGTGNLIYPGVVIRDGVMHLMFSGWNPSGAVYENIFYMRSTDFGCSWTRSDGKPIPVPLAYDTAEPKSVDALDRVTRSFHEGQFDCNTHDLELLIDQQGKPHLLYYSIPTYFPRPQRFPRASLVHVRRDEDGWKHHLLSVDPAIDVEMGALTESSDGRLHCLCKFRTKDRRYFDLGYCYSDDSGDSWSTIERITEDADAEQSSYMYSHWCSEPFGGDFYFIFNRSGGGPIFLGRLRLSGGSR